MNECKHNWVESSFAARYRKPNEYMYQCTRCWQSRFVALMERK
jgi:hypothetical protein